MSSGTVRESTPPVGAEASALWRMQCKRWLTAPRIAEFKSFSAYEERLREIELDALPELVALQVALLGPVDVPDLAGGFAHPEDPKAMLVPMTNGGFAVVDAEDYPLVKRYEWYQFNGYAWARETHLNRSVSVQMHRLILMVGIHTDNYVDHRNLDSLDNRLANLRLATHTQNLWNSGMRSNNTSGVKGVCWNKQANKWRAKVKANNKKHEKDFATLEEATAWVRAKREELHGEFARHG